MAAHVEPDEENKQKGVVRELVGQNTKKSSAAAAISYHIQNLMDASNKKFVFLINESNLAKFGSLIQSTSGGAVKSIRHV